MALNLDKTKFLAVVCVTLVAAATACSSPGEFSANSDFSADELITELGDQGFEFDPGSPRREPVIGQIHGYIRTTEFVLAGKQDKLWAHEFIGPAEALMAATRVLSDGSGFEFPTDDKGHWTAVSGYGVPSNLNYFVKGKTIAAHLGDASDLTDALIRIMDWPFAGDRAYRVHQEGAEPSVDFAGFQGIWREEPVQVTDVEAEFVLIGESETRVLRVLFTATQPRSTTCEGRSFEERSLGDDQINITLVSRIANTDVLSFVDGCGINLHSGEHKMYFQDLLPGTIYDVKINGETVATVHA